MFSICVIHPNDIKVELLLITLDVLCIFSYSTSTLFLFLLLHFHSSHHNVYIGFSLIVPDNWSGAKLEVSLARALMADCCPIKC